VSVTTGMRDYLSSLAEELIDNPDEPDAAKIRDFRNTLWGRMTADEQSNLNGLVEDIFGEWL
jgi:hypothetical protein